MKILMAASECVPFVKVGGLADVVGTLPDHLKAKKHDVRIILPRYRQVDSARFSLKMLPYRLQIPVGNTIETARLMEARTAAGVPVYFIDNPKFFDRADVYRTPAGDFEDNRERFIFFSRAVLEAAKAIAFQPDIIHCHDWQTGIIPAYLKTVYKLDAFFWNTASVYTIHNIAYQGMFAAETARIAHFSPQDFEWNKLEYYGKFNFMKAGIVYADTITTVSPTYAKEILLTEEGRGMEGILRSRRNDVTGILNGIDYREWNPGTDTMTAAHFSKKDTAPKSACKQDLQRECGLAVSPESFLLGAVSRLDPQKGYDLVAEALPEIVENGIQVAILGSGDREIHDAISSLAQRYPGRVSFNKGFNNPLAHKIYAGADAFLMPSRFEPCGLGQMIALAYGTMPVVRKTGGLADTVSDFNRKTATGNGITFMGVTAEELMTAINRAHKLFKQPRQWKKIITNAMSCNFSWPRAAELYILQYERSIDKRQ